MIKDINYKNYGQYYEIDEDGNVWSKPRTVIKSDGVIQNRGRRLLSWSDNTDGYPTVKLCIDKHEERIAVHRLVAMTFMPNYDGTLEVNHIDCNRQNPSVSNLEWITHSDNVNHSYKLGRYQKPQFVGACNPRAKAVELIDLKLSFPCVKECAEFLIAQGKTKGSIMNASSQIIKVCSGNLRLYLGYTFRYISKTD